MSNNTLSINEATTFEQIAESNEPVFFTKNGYGNMVVMSMEAYKRNLFESEIYLKLKEAEYQAGSTKKRYTHDKAIAELRKIIR